MDRLWDIDEFQNFSNLTKKFVDVLYDMFDDDDDDDDEPSWRRYALATSEYIWAYLPDIKSNLNLCSYAQVCHNFLYKYFVCGKKVGRF